MMRRSIENGVLKRAAFIANVWPEVRRSFEGGVYQRALLIKGNTANLFNSILCFIMSITEASLYLWYVLDTTYETGVK